MSDKQTKAFEDIQQIFVKHDLSVEQGLGAAGDTLAWSLLVTFFDLEDCVVQLRSMVEDIEATMRINHPAIAARREVLMEIANSSSGWVN